MKYSSVFRKGFLASLLIHGAIVLGGYLTTDGRDKLIVSKIRIHLTPPEQHSSLKLKSAPKTILAATATRKPTSISPPKTAPLPLPIITAQSNIQSIPVTTAVTRATPSPLVEPGSKTELRPELKTEPIVKPVLVTEKKAEKSLEPESEPTPAVQENTVPTPKTALTQPPPTLNNNDKDKMIQVTAIESPDETNQKQKDAIMEAEMHYRDEVIRLIESNKYYPKRLQKMRKEGDVLVAFTLNRNGNVLGLEIIDVKGSSLFKEAALKAVKSAGLFPSFPGQSSRQTWSFRVPLSYRLLRS